MKALRHLFTFALVGFVATHTLAQERGTKDEAKAMAEQAVAHVKAVGADKAYGDFTADKAKWTKNDLYVFAIDFKGATLAHGANEKLIGKNLADMKDQNGKFFIRDMIEIAKTKGSGWVEYDWAHPQTKKVEGKASYALKIPGADALIGVGIYR